MTTFGLCLNSCSCAAEYSYFLPFMDGTSAFGACLTLVDLHTPSVGVLTVFVHFANVLGVVGDTDGSTYSSLISSKGSKVTACSL